MANVCHGQAPPSAGLLHFRRWNINAFPIAELADHYRVAPGTVGRWVSQDRITGHPDPRNARRKLYPLDDVQAAYDRRHNQSHD